MLEEDNRTEELRTGLELTDAEYAAHPAISGSSDEEGQASQRDRAIRTAAVFSTGVLVCIAALFLLTYVFDVFRIVPGSQYKYYSDLDDACGKYYEIMELIGEDPIAVTTPAEISGDMLKQLVKESGDPYAEYFTKEEYTEFWKSYTEGYVGIGITVAQDGDDVTVVAVFEDGPAAAAGMKAGDSLIRVDGKEPADVDEVIEMIAGKEGTPVTVTVNRDGNDFDLKMNRAVIDRDSVGYAEYKDDPSIGIIRILSFKKGTADEFKAAVKELQNKGCDRFIIDLRGNGGGITDESIEIADYLLPECRIMTEVKKNKSEKVYNSKAGSADIEYVVLTDGGTASASEILAGAIQDNKGGTIIGSKTYGKGVTQLTRKFKDGSAIKVTECEYLRPNGGHVDGIGISPDIETKAEDALDTAIGELKR